MKGFVEFEFEFYSEAPDVDGDLREEAERRLWDLTEGHDDITGASVGIDELTGSETPHLYQARVVVFMRPNNITAVEKEEVAEFALKKALSAVERQVYEAREKLRETWKQP